MLWANKTAKLKPLGDTLLCFSNFLNMFTIFLDVGFAWMWDACLEITHMDYVNWSERFLKGWKSDLRFWKKRFFTIFNFFRKLDGQPNLEILKASEVPTPTYSTTLILRSTTDKPIAKMLNVIKNVKFSWSWYVIKAFYNDVIVFGKNLKKIETNVFFCKKGFRLNKTFELKNLQTFMFETQ